MTLLTILSTYFFIVSVILACKIVLYNILCSLACTWVEIIDCHIMLLKVSLETFHCNEMLNWFLRNCNVFPFCRFALFPKDLFS